MRTYNIVLVVGVDMCGKTNIAKALAKSLNVPYFKASSERTSFANDQSRFINDIRWADSARLDMLTQVMLQGYISGMVFDRGHACQWVYSRMFERERDDDAVWKIDEQLANLSAVIVIPYRTTYDGIVDDIDSTLRGEKLVKLGTLYDDFASLTKCPVLKLNVDDEDLNRELNDINDFLATL